MRVWENMGTRCSVRKQPETFCWTLIMRRSRSAWLLSKGTAKSSRKRSTAHLPPESRSSRLRAGLCLARPDVRLDGSDWLGARGGGLAWYASRQEGGIATKQACQQQRIQFVLAQRFGSPHLGFHVHQQP